MSSQYFLVSEIPGVPEESLGAYCSFCGKKNSGTIDPDTGGWTFICTCPEAQYEAALIQQIEECQERLDRFNEDKFQRQEVTRLQVYKALHEKAAKACAERLERLTEEINSSLEDTHEGS